MGSHPTTMASCCGDKNWLASCETKRDGSVKIRLLIDLGRLGVNGLTRVPQKDLGCTTSLTPSTLPQFASTKRVIWLSTSTASGAPTESRRSALPPVPCCGSVVQQFSHVRVSQCSSPKSSESKRMRTTMRGPSRTASPSACPFGHPLAPLGSHGRARTCPGGKASMASVSTGYAPRSPSLGFSAVWIVIHLHTAAEVLALTEGLSLRKKLVDVKEVLHVAGVIGWASGSLPVARDL